MSRAKDEDISPERYREWAEERLVGVDDARGARRGRRGISSSPSSTRRASRCWRRLASPTSATRSIRTLDLLRRRPAVLERLRRTIPLHPGRRVPGHEPRPARDAPPARGGGRGQHNGRRRRRSGDLPVARGGRGQPARLSRDLSRRRGRWSSSRTIAPGSRSSIPRPASSPTTTPTDSRCVAGIDKRLRAIREGGVPVRHVRFDTVSAEADGVAQMIDEALGRGFRPRDVAILVRSNGDADPFQRALNVRRIPHRFSGSRGLYAREEVRLLVAFLRLLANPSDSVSAFYLAASEVYGFPETDLLRLNAYARQKTRPLLEVFRGLPDNEDLAGVGGASREACRSSRGGRGLPQRVEVPRRRTGRGALLLPAALGSARPPGPGGHGGERGAGAQHRPLLRRGEGVRRRGGARPRSGLRRAPRPLA